ncbi:hypothetical protein JRY29_03395 [Salmonella enterica subsp. enterica serovar Kentucky]|nr:hypothetical protein JRY29_03395 [Salmonella enterica subsp. enterica serovar Kentucky]
MEITIHHVIWQVSFRKCPSCHHVTVLWDADVSAEKSGHKRAGRVTKPVCAKN